MIVSIEGKKKVGAQYWEQFRQNIIGSDFTFTNRHGMRKALYADWIAGGRLYEPIEKALTEQVGQYVANPHSYSSYTGAGITTIYNQARQIIKKHVNGSEDDVLVTTGSGMTGALVRFQEILGLRSQPKEKNQRPVVFITHMEHHSNHVSWLETNADVVVVPPGTDNLFSLENLESKLKEYQDRETKIGAFTACSNVTGIINPIHEMAKLMHKHGGYCFADFAASAPYVEIDMHPKDEEERLDAITFSPHKFLGGPGSCGVLIFDKKFHSGTPCVPGGGNVRWTDPWGGYGYTSDVEALEDGGTPGYMQTIKAAMAIQLKEEMGVENIQRREEELLDKAISELSAINRLSFVDSNFSAKRIGALSFNIGSLHYNLVVRLLNDRFGVQSRGGWSCAGTYAHFLFGIDSNKSKQITDGIEAYNASNKPGWVRISLHPTMTDDELDFIINAIHQVCEFGRVWANDYQYDPKTNEFLPLEDMREDHSYKEILEPIKKSRSSSYLNSVEPLAS